MKLPLLPMNQYQIQTGLTVTEVNNRLREVVGRKNFIVQSGPKKYWGNFTVKGFEISRSIPVRNSFLPVLKGTYKLKENGVRIDVTAKLPKGTLIGMTVWMAFVCIWLMLGLFLAWENTEILLLGLGFLFFGWGISNAGFWIEEKKARHDLQRLFEDAGDILSDRPVKWHFKNAHSVKVKKAKEFWILSSILCLTVTGVILYLIFGNRTYLIDPNLHFSWTNIDVAEFISLILLVCLSVLCTILTMLGVIFVKKAHFILRDEEIDYQVGKTKYTIPYQELKEAVFVLHHGVIKADYQERGISGYKLTVDPYVRGVRSGWYPYYDLIDYDDRVICSVDAGLVFLQNDLLVKLLYKGISVKGSKGDCKLKRKILKGEVIEKLRVYPVQRVSENTIQKYIHFYNDRAAIWNKRKGKFLRKSRPLMEIGDIYEAGYIYWTEDLQEVGICFHNGEMQRALLGNYLAVDKPVKHTVVYCIKDLTKEIMLLFRLE